MLEGDAYARAGGGLVVVPLYTQDRCDNVAYILNDADCKVLLFGTRGKNARTLAPGRRQVNFIAERKREHSRKPDQQYDIIEGCSPGPFLELFARGTRPGWTVWGNQARDYTPTWRTYANHSQSLHVAAE